MHAKGKGDSVKWDDILAELERKRTFARAMGGTEKLEKQRVAGKLDARQRAAALFDEGSFVELGGLAGNLSEHGPAPAPSDALVAGFGRVEGRPVLAGIEDFTVLGGSIGDAAASKRHRLAQLARQERVPLVFMLEGAGHRLTNEHATPSPNDLQALAELSGLVPMVCLVMGASAGHGALTAPLSDFVVMTEAAAMFVAGPPIVKAAIGESVSKEELGGPRVHVDVSGVAHNLVPDDARAIALARRYLGYFPPNAWQAPPASRDKGGGGDTLPRRLDAILDLIDPDPRIAFDIRPVLALLVDRDSLLEVQPSYGGSLVTALARLGGRSVAIVASNSAVGGGTKSGALHGRGGCISSARGFPGRQSWRPPRPRFGKSRRAASCCAHVRGAAPPARAQAPRHLAQSLRFRLVDHGHESVRWANAQSGISSHQPGLDASRERRGRRRARRRHAAAGHGRTGEWRLAARRPDGL
jgi:acetyl-CoA carboxylase carboxyltransferase component